MSTTAILHMCECVCVLVNSKAWPCFWLCCHSNPVSCLSSDWKCTGETHWEEQWKGKKKGHSLVSFCVHCCYSFCVHCCPIAAVLLWGVFLTVEQFTWLAVVLLRLCLNMLVPRGKPDLCLHQSSTPSFILFVYYIDICPRKKMYNYKLALPGLNRNNCLSGTIPVWDFFSVSAMRKLLCLIAVVQGSLFK